MVLGLSLISSLLITPQAQAVDFESYGDVAFNYLFHQKPSSLKDASAFQTMSGYLGGIVELSDRLNVVAELSYGRQREATTGQYSVLVEKAFLDYVLTETWSAEMGSIGNSWIEMMEQESPAAWMISPYLQSSWMRLRSDSRADQGFRLNGVWDDSELQVSVVNGEGQSSDEIGPKKDMLVHYQKQHRVSLDQWVSWAIAWSEGSYDNMDATVAARRRYLAFVNWQMNAVSVLRLELLRSEDPADSLNGKGWDKVDLLAQGGQVARGQGGSIEYERDLSAVLSANVRYDVFDSAVGVDAKGLETRMLGFHYFPEALLQISLAWVDVMYKNRHTASVRDINQWIISARAHW